MMDPVLSLASLVWQNRDVGIFLMNVARGKNTPIYEAMQEYNQKKLSDALTNAAYMNDKRLAWRKVIDCIEEVRQLHELAVEERLDGKLQGFVNDKKCSEKTTQAAQLALVEAFYYRQVGEYDLAQQRLERTLQLMMYAAELMNIHYRGNARGKQAKINDEAARAQLVRLWRSEANPG